MDKINQERIAKLHPFIRQTVYDLVERINTKILTGSAKMRITQGLRTIEEQNALYAQGRTKPGKKVTNAKGGQSIHNFALAIDFCLIVDGKVEWSMTKDFDGDKVADWMEVVNEFKKEGFVWGGDWKSFKDYPHLEKSKGLGWRELNAKLHANDTFVDNGIKYVKI